MDSLLEIVGLTKRFGAITAVDDLRFTVKRGEVLGFLGPNGAGKTTTMRMICGFLPPSAGTVRVCGFDVEGQAIEAKKRLGYLPEGAPSYGDMTPAGLLSFVASLHGLGGKERSQAVDRAVERLGLGTVLQRPIETLSKGFKRRVGLAQAILLDPQVLILDEPTDGLDPNQKHEVRRLLREMAGDKVIVISTHILEEVEALCSRAIIIAAGKIVADETPEALKTRSINRNAIAVKLDGDRVERARAALSSVAEIAEITAAEHVAQPDRQWLRIVPRNGADILVSVRESLKSEDISVEEIFVEHGRLDDVFRQLTAGKA